MQTIDREWIIDAGFRVRDASHGLWRRVQRFYADLFGDGLALIAEGEGLDHEYFRQRMAEHRRREKQLRMRRIAEALAQRSGDLVPDQPIDLVAVPGLVEALDGLVSLGIPAEVLRGFAARSDFDLEGYQQHVLSHFDHAMTDFDAIPPLIDDARKDRVFRFIAVIFLAHARRIDLRQDGNHILITPHETHEQGQGLPRATQEDA